MSNSNQLTAQIRSKTESHCYIGQLNGTDRLIEYTENTTIHGIKYLGEKQRPITGKIFWIVIFVISFIILGFFVQDVLKKFNQKSVILVDDEQPTPIHSIPFPAVTICPAVKIKSKYFPPELAVQWFERGANKSMLLDLAYLICNQHFLTVVQDNTNIAKYLNRSHIELLHKISPKIMNSFGNLKFASKREYRYGLNEDDEYTIEVPFSYILTNEGICFTFNVPSEILNEEPSLQTEYKYHNIRNKTKFWNIEDGYSGYPRFPRAVWGSGPGSGLYLIMTSQFPDLNTFCQPTEIGYKIMLHSPGEYPTTLEKFISIPHTTFAQIKVTPKITKTSHDLSKLSPQLRQCFYDHERKLTYYKFYNRVNCKLECLANYSLQQYGCVHFSLPRKNTELICGKGVKLSQMYETEEIMNSYFQYKTKIIDEYKTKMEDDEPIDFKKFSNFNCNCLPACNSIEYEYSVEMENVDVAKITKNYLFSNSTNKDSAAIIEIFFGMTKVTGATRKHYYTFSDLISSIGGLVGLFMGASVLSIFEIIYFFIVR